MLDLRAWRTVRSLYGRPTSVNAEDFETSGRK